MEAIKDEAETSRNFRIFTIFQDFISKRRLNELERIESRKQKADKEKMLCKAYNKKYDFKKIKMIRAFGDVIENVTITIYMATSKSNQ